MSLIERLAGGERIGERVALVVAHPDDETIGLGSRLSLLDDLTLIHLTDGAPDDPSFAESAGFGDPMSYAAARRAELDRALTALGAVPARRVALGLTDQRVHEEMESLVNALVAALAGHAAVITHAYEHGHNDHDSAALAVTLACARLGATAPERFEFAGYHRVGVTVAFGRFRRDPTAPETLLPLTAGQIAAKRAAFAAHATQAGILTSFDPARETLRRTPDYDWSAPAPPRKAAYELWGFGRTALAWRAAIAPWARTLKHRSTNL